MIKVQLVYQTDPPVEAELPCVPRVGEYVEWSGTKVGRVIVVRYQPSADCAVVHLRLVELAQYARDYWPWSEPHHVASSLWP